MRNENECGVAKSSPNRGEKSPLFVVAAGASGAERHPRRAPAAAGFITRTDFQHIRAAGEQCSDGLTEMLTNEVIAATLDAELAPEAAAKSLIARANEGESTDNITVVVVRFDSAEPDAAEGRNTR